MRPRVGNWGSGCAESHPGLTEAGPGRKKEIALGTSFIIIHPASVLVSEGICYEQSTWNTYPSVANAYNQTSNLRVTGEMMECYGTQRHLHTTYCLSCQP